MSDATLTIFGPFNGPSDTLPRLAEDLLTAVGLHIHGQVGAALDPREVTVQTVVAANGSLSGYLFEIRVTLDYEDYPFSADQFNTPEAQQACRDKAKDVWEAMNRSDLMEGPFLVWVLAGHMSGYHDGQSHD